MNHGGNEIDKAESKDGSVDVDDGIDFDFDNADEEETNSYKRCHENKLFYVYLSLSCLFQVEYAEKSFSRVMMKDTCRLW